MRFPAEVMSLDHSVVVIVNWVCNPNPSLGSTENSPPVGIAFILIYRVSDEIEGLSPPKIEKSTLLAVGILFTLKLFPPR